MATSEERVETELVDPLFEYLRTCSKYICSKLVIKIQIPNPVYYYLWDQFGYKRKPKKIEISAYVSKNKMIITELKE